MNSSERKEILTQNGEKSNSPAEPVQKPHRFVLNQTALLNFVSFLAEQRSGRIYEDKGYAWMLCPFHEDTNPSLRVNLKTGYFHCVACGETGSAVKLWRKIQGYESLEQARQELVSIGVFKPAKPKEEAVYHYYDKEGWLLFRKRKLRHWDGSKTFVIEHYDYENDLWKTGKPKDCPPVLYDYNYSVIEARYNGGVLYYVEGEKDVETLKALGFLATTAGGAKDWKPELANELAGLDVVIIPDNDPAGKELLVKVGTDLLSSASSVRWVDLTEEAKKLGIDLPEKGDITDFLELVKQKGLDPVEVVEGFTLLGFDPQELQGRAQKERLLSSGLFLTKEAIASLSSVEFLFEGFLPWGYMVVLSSEPGVGKSRLSLALAREAIKRGVMVVYLDGDNPIPYIVENLQSFGLLDELETGLFYLSRHQKEICISPTDEAWKAVKALLKTTGRSFIVVDTLGSMSKGFDPNSDKDMRTVLSELKALRAAGHAILILHHPQKYASGDERLPAGFKYRGSGVIKSDVDGLYFMERDKKESNCYLLHAGKLRFVGEERLKVRITAEGLVIETDRTSKLLQEAMEVLNLMHEGKSYAFKEMVQYANVKLGFSEKKTRTLLQLLEEQGFVEITGGKGRTGVLITRKPSKPLAQEEDDTLDDLELPF